MDSIIKSLKNISLFKGLNDCEYEILESICTLKHYSKGDIIFYEKDKLKSIFFLVAGEVELYKIDRFDKEIFLDRLKDNAFIYTVSNLYDDQPKGAFYNVEVLKDSKVLLIDTKKFKSLFLTKPQIISAMLEESYKLILQLQYILNRDIVFDGTAKVAYMLCNDLESFNSMKKHQIAHSLHLQPETLSRIIKKLTRNEFITIEDGNITIKNLDALKQIYE